MLSIQNHAVLSERNNSTPSWFQERMWRRYPIFALSHIISLFEKQWYIHVNSTNKEASSNLRDLAYACEVGFGFFFFSFYVPPYSSPCPLLILLLLTASSLWNAIPNVGFKFSSHSGVNNKHYNINSELISGFMYNNWTEYINDMCKKLTYRGRNACFFMGVLNLFSFNCISKLLIDSIAAQIDI
jgi:hypothetical protein